MRLKQLEISLYLWNYRERVNHFISEIALFTDDPLYTKKKSIDTTKKWLSFFTIGDYNKKNELKLSVQL